MQNNNKKKNVSYLFYLCSFSRYVVDKQAQVYALKVVKPPIVFSTDFLSQTFIFDTIFEHYLLYMYMRMCFKEA